MTLLILSAIKYGENANLGRFCADLKPVDSLTKGEMPQAWQEVFVDEPAHWGHSQSFRVGNHGVNSSCRVVGSLVSGASWSSLGARVFYKSFNEICDGDRCAGGARAGAAVG